MHGYFTTVTPCGAGLPAAPTPGGVLPVCSFSPPHTNAYSAFSKGHLLCASRTSVLDASPPFTTCATQNPATVTFLGMETQQGWFRCRSTTRTREEVKRPICPCLPEHFRTDFPNVPHGWLAVPWVFKTLNATESHTENHFSFCCLESSGLCQRESLSL